MKPLELPVIYVRDLVMKPDKIHHLYVGRNFSIDSILYSKKFNQGKIIVLTQKSCENAKPILKKDLYSVGTLCRLEDQVMLQDETMKVSLQGKFLFNLERLFQKEGVNFAKGVD